MSVTPSIVAVGAAAIDEWYAVSNLPEADGGAFASEVTSSFGGVGANVAVALDRLGRDVGLVSRVGDDEYGRRAREHLAETGVDASRVTVGDDPSTRSLVLSAPDGERAIVTTGESFRELRLAAADREAIAAADVAFLTGYTPDAVSRRVLSVVESARDPPALVFDLSGPVEELVGRGTEPETVHRLLHRADLFVAGDVAAAAYFGSEAAAVERIAAAQRARGDAADGNGCGGAPDADTGWPRAVLTHGADGMTVVADGDARRFDAFDVDVVDATGAGDAFVAGLIDRWVAGEGEGGTATAENGDLADGVRFAAAVAAINCTERFAQGGLPTREAVERFLSARE
ncbi:carbohydrate kinase family protein [Halorubrum sp. SD626R]|uniref:carbohydrate kinase family protein n=1 Tax=Halorubrum sp. SD626R TaxID=1419722 RepID=UPI000AD26D20|nr:carbohydrate kinase family protein [Halorubrum sp. SD626R]TKX81079.1 carbohydrate kinase family protein [Halorubrum sp. SD626R]